MKVCVSCKADRKRRGAKTPSGRSRNLVTCRHCQRQVCYHYATKISNDGLTGTCPCVVNKGVTS